MLSNASQADLGAPALRIALGLTLAVAFGLLAIGLAAAWEHTADDAYITLRYARNLAGGEGITWNPGEPAVEGYSNFLFVLVGAALMEVAGSQDPMPWLEALGALAALGTLAATYLLAFRLARGSDRTGLDRAPRRFERLSPHAAGAAAAMAVAVHPGQAFWAVSGMETTVCQLLILLSACAVTLADRDGANHAPASGRAEPWRWLAAASLLVFLASLTRPESPIVFAGLLPYAVLSAAKGSTKLRAAAWLTVPFAALYLPYTAWRLSTFGRWLPNSASCKAGMASDAWLLGSGFLEFAGPLLVLALAGLALRPRSAQFMLLGVPLAYFGVFRGVDPVMSHLDRHFLAALPFVAVAGALGVQALLERLLSERFRRLAGIALIAAALVFGTLSASRTLAAVRQGVRLAHPLEELRRELARHLEDRLRAGESYAIGDTGLVPFLVDAKVFDIYCLNCREATAPPIDRSPKRLAAWILSRRPRFVVVQIVAGGSERGVFAADRALQAEPLLRTHYVRRVEVGGPEDPLHYLVFERRTGGSL